ncbi:MAG: metallophosphoesterase [Verrucomicrobiota bacterium]
MKPCPQPYRPYPNLGVLTWAAALLLLVPAGLAADAARDWVFLMSSDPHIGSDDAKANPPVTADEIAARAKANLAGVLQLPGEAYPSDLLPGLPAGKIPTPRALLLAGDLTDNAAWPLFEKVFPPTLEPGNIPVFVAAGNHDGPPSGATRLGIIARNRLHAEAKRIDVVAANGMHYAWKWAGVHFICVNLCPADSTDNETPFTYGKPGPGSWNDPLNALQFLKDYLKNVGPGEPIIIWQHYGYCEGFNFDWNWWSAKQRRLFYDVVKEFNVVALLHGHTHAPAHYLWPDPKADPQEVQRLFGDAPPKALRSFEVFSAGSVGGGDFYLFRILDERLFALHHNSRGWTKDPGLTTAISLSKGGEHSK